MLSLGEQIKQARKAKGMTQEELAKAIGINRGIIAKYEADIVKEIPNDRLLQIEQVLPRCFERELFITFRQSDYAPEVWEIIKKIYKSKKEM